MKIGQHCWLTKIKSANIRHLSVLGLTVLSPVVSNGYTSSVQRHTVLTHPFNCLTFGHSGTKD